MRRNSRIGPERNGQKPRTISDVEERLRCGAHSGNLDTTAGFTLPVSTLAMRSLGTWRVPLALAIDSLGDLQFETSSFSAS
jgi:hypothetical protein